MGAEKQLKHLAANGFVTIENVFTGSFLEKLQRKNRRHWKAFKKTKVFARNDGSIKTSAKFRGSTVLFLAKGRYDLALESGVFQSKKFLENAKIMEVVESLFKTGFTCFAGSLPSMPGSADGPWHQDTWPLFDDPKFEERLPPYYLTVLIPLVDLRPGNGPTELIARSHNGKDMGRRSYVLGKAGSALIFDGRVHHRGLANVSDKTRHMLYIVYCKKWYYEYPEDLPA